MAERIALGSAAALILIIGTSGAPRRAVAAGLVLSLVAAAWGYVCFRVTLRSGGGAPWAVASVVVGFALAGAAHGLLREELPSIGLVFVPVVVIAGLLTGPRAAVGTAAAASLAYWLTGAAAGGPPGPAAIALNTGVFLLSGSVAGLLARELRSHYLGELEEREVATAGRHRLLAVLDSVDEAVVLRDREGTIQVINQRASELFELDPDACLGTEGVEVLRQIARKTEDPEGFMEMFQELYHDPELELRSWVEQVIPDRRQLRLLSRPTVDENGVLVGRIDVYTDVTESVTRTEEIARLYEEARRTAESYQRSLLPSTVPTLPRLNVVAHYIPAAGRRAVCGDFYDFLPMPEGKMGVALGDVCGIGPSAANDAAFARYTLRSFAADDDDPGRLLERLNRQIYEQTGSERFTRMFIGVLDPERAVIEYANAGHVPPVVFRATSAEVEWLGEGGIVLGIESDARYKCARAELKSGDMLVLYTDGVTEAPRDGRPFGQGKFTDLVHQYGVGTPGELVQAIRRSVEAWTFEGELRDDLALLVCQVASDAVIEEPSRELVLPNEPARVAEVRRFIAAFLADLRAPVEDSQELLIAVNEAAANAWRYGRKPQGRSELRVRAFVDGPDVLVSVSDEGAGFDLGSLEKRGLPDRFASGGRGLFLMRQLSHGLDFEVSPQGTTVTIRRRMLEDKGA